MARRRWLLVELTAVLTACSGPDRAPGDRNAAIEGTWQSAGNDEAVPSRIHLTVPSADRPGTILKSIVPRRETPSSA